MPSEQLPDSPMAQVTGVNQLAEVQPTNRDFQALLMLVQRYGVMSGYPDSTFQGNRAFTCYFGILGTLANVAIGQPFGENDLGNAAQPNFEGF